MDPLTHMVTGALVAQVLAPEEHRFAMALVAAGAGVVPDVDFVARKAKNQLLFLQLHRGFTHSLLATPIIGVCAAWSGSLLFGAPFWLLLAVSVAAALSHLLLDTIMHATGLQLFWPWRRKISLHLVVGLNPLTSSARCGERSLGVCLRCTMHSAVLSPLVLMLWAGFLASLLLPWWQVVSGATLALAGLFLAYTQVMRSKAGLVMRRRLHAEGAREALVQVFSGSFNPNIWVSVVSRRDGTTEVARVHSLGGAVEPLASHGPSEEGEEVAATRAAPTVVEFLNNAVVPHATVYRNGRQRPLVVWRDLAFAFSPTVSLFAARVELDPQLGVASEEFRERWDRPPETVA